MCQAPPSPNDESDPKDDVAAPSVLWWITERSTRWWANRLSLLSISGFTISEGKPALEQQTFRHLSTREALYAVSFVAAAFCTFGTLGGLPTTCRTWPWIVITVFAAHQIIESFVLMVSLGLFGSHAKYRPSSYGAASRQKRERAVLILAFAYFLAMMWFAALYRACEHFDSTQIAVGTDTDGIARPVDVFVLSYSTQTTVGYGTVAPAGTAVAVIAAVQSSFGIFFIALAVANMMSILNIASPQTTGETPRREREASHS